MFKSYETCTKVSEGRETRDDRRVHRLSYIVHQVGPDARTSAQAGAVLEESLQDSANIVENVLVYKTVLKLVPLMESLERIRAENIAITQNNLLENKVYAKNCK
mgnify:CR=1 FL=1